MNKKKAIAVSVVLLLVLLIGGLLAYFTSTDSVQNVFTIGDGVSIAISEVWNENDGLNLRPGAVVTKAPSVQNTSTTEPAYVFVEVIVPCYGSSGLTADTPLFTFTANNGWTLINTPSVDTGEKTITYRYAYGSASAMTSLAASSTTTTPVFSSVTLAPSLTVSQKESANSDLSIDINAYGIQTDGLGVTAPTDIFALF